jgi:hypothetical protein
VGLTERCGKFEISSMSGYPIVASYHVAVRWFSHGQNLGTERVVSINMEASTWMASIGAFQCSSGSSPGSTAELRSTVLRMTQSRWPEVSVDARCPTHCRRVRLPVFAGRPPIRNKIGRRRFRTNVLGLSSSLLGTVPRPRLSFPRHGCL